MMKSLPLGLQNNNPTNIRYVPSTHWLGQLGKYKGFVKFDTLTNGYRAFFLLCRTYRNKYAVSSVQSFLQRFAPSVENNTQNYIKYVVSSLSERGFTSEFSLNRDFLASFAEIITSYECGYCPYSCVCEIRKTLDIYYKYIIRK